MVRREGIKSTIYSILISEAHCSMLNERPGFQDLQARQHYSRNHQPAIACNGTLRYMLYMSDPTLG
jgi:hypothetical protein